MSPDINALDLSGEFVEVNYATAKAEDFFQPPLADDGEHMAILHLGDKGVKQEKQKDKSTGQKTGAGYVNVHIQAKILDDSGKEGLSVFDNLTSILMGGMSRLHAVLSLAGDPLPERASIPDIEDACKKSFAQPLKIGIVTQWEAQYEDETKPKGSKERYVTILKGQAKFPQILDQDGNPTGKYDPEVKDPKSGRTARAQVRITKYYRRTS